MSPDSIRHEVIFHHAESKAGVMREFVVQRHKPEQVFTVTVRVDDMGWLTIELPNEVARIFVRKIEEALAPEESDQ